MHPSTGSIQIVERYIKKEFVTIGTIELTGRCQWWWTVTEVGKEGWEKPYSQGAASSRAEALSFVRREYRKQQPSIRVGSGRNKTELWQK